MEALDESNDFHRNINGWVLAAVDAGADSFERLLERLPSVYPSMVQASLKTLAFQGKLPVAVADKLARPTLSKTEKRINHSFLPLPHPLNYEWRFTPEGSERLLDAAVSLSTVDDTVLMIGTPTVATGALAKPPGRQLVFLGEDNPVTRRLSSLASAMGAELSVSTCSERIPSTECAQVVIIDPPWYLDFVRWMVTTASIACKIGGYVISSLPPKGVRANAESDRQTTLHIARRCGLEHVETLEQAVRYETPFFEANALAACGLSAPLAWRTGDMVIFKKVTSFVRPITLATIRKERWTEVEIGRMRLFVGRQKPSLSNGALGRLITGDVLPTVSRKDPRRANANVCTSGNRIFSSDVPDSVLAAAISLSGESYGAGFQPQLCGRPQEREALDRLVQELRDIAAREVAEERGFSTPQILGSEKWTSISTKSDNESKVTLSGHAI